MELKEKENGLKEKELSGYQELIMMMVEMHNEKIEVNEIVRKM